MTGNDIRDIRAFYNNVWNGFQSSGVHQTTRVVHHDFCGSIKFTEDNQHIVVNVPSSNPLQILSWPCRSDEDDTDPGKGRLDIFITVHQTLGLNEGNGDHDFEILDSSIRIFYCEAQPSQIHHDIRNYSPIVKTCIRYDYHPKYLDHHPLFHMHFDKGLDLLEMKIDPWCKEVISQIRIPSPPKDLLGTLWGLVADHVPGLMDSYKTSVNRAISRQPSKNPKINSHPVYERIQNTENNHIYTGQWYPEWDT